MKTRDEHEVVLYDTDVRDSSPYTIHGAVCIDKRWLPFAWTAIGEFAPNQKHELDLVIWTKETPKESGYYWWRKRKGKASIIAKLVRSEMENDPDPRLIFESIDERVPNEGTYGSGEWWPFRITEPV